MTTIVLSLIIIAAIILTWAEERAHIRAARQTSVEIEDDLDIVIESDPPYEEQKTATDTATNWE